MVDNGDSRKELWKKTKLDVGLKEGSKGEMSATTSTDPGIMQEFVAGLRELNSNYPTITVNMDNVTYNNGASLKLL